MAAPKINPIAYSKKAALTVDQPREFHPDQNRFWQSNLFSDVYLLNDVPTKYRDVWNKEDGEFYSFCEQFRNLCEDLEGEDLNSWSERTTINRFIKPILAMLGWADRCSKKNEEPWAEDEPLTIRENGEQKIYKPDLLVVDDPMLLKHIERKTGEAKLTEARQSSIIAIEAKYWGRIDESNHPIQKKSEESRSENKTRKDATKSLDFDEQCLKYVEILHHDYGILTDGRTWRLYHREVSSGPVKRNYQFNLWKLLKTVRAGLETNKADYLLFIEQAKYFYHIFSKKSLHSTDGSRRFVDDLIADSRKYTDRVEEDLKTRFVKAMTIACNGFRRSIGKSFSEDKIHLIRSVSESHIFNILFIRYSESKNILPLRQNGEYRKQSLSNIVDKLDLYDPEKEEEINTRILERRFKEQFSYAPDGTELYDMLLNLVNILQNGLNHPDAKFSISGFKETVFSAEELNFIKKAKLTNREMVSLIFELTYTDSDKAGQYQQIAYSFFAPRQLGSIYESFLEFRIEHATEDLAFVNRQWKKANLSSAKISERNVPTARKGQLFFSPNNSDRKATGSYYTPDCVVQLILDKTLADSIKTKTSKQMLSMRICDPAMGSGHFLAGALDFMARNYLEKLDEETADDVHLSVADAKRLVLHNCIYGVDINPRAVKLAKMSLWLESATANMPLEPLDDQIKCANSLTDRELWFSEWGADRRGFDAVVGNPPYLGEKGHKEIFQEISKGWLGERFYLGKMDLFYFFFHLGLDILKPDGRLGFITTNYFTTALGGKKLRKDFHERASLELLMNLNELKVFGEAAGQHNMVTVMVKTVDSRTCRLISTKEDGKCTPEVLGSILSGRNKNTYYSDLVRSELYDGEQLYIRINQTASNSGQDVFDSIFRKLMSKVNDPSSHLATQ